MRRRKMSDKVKAYLLMWKVHQSHNPHYPEVEQRAVHVDEKEAHQSAVSLCQNINTISVQLHEMVAVKSFNVKYKPPITLTPINEEEEDDS
jgi:hypothetical protein